MNRSAGAPAIDLLGQRAARAVSDDDLVAGGSLEAAGLRVHRLFEARRGKDRDLGGRGWQRRPHDETCNREQAEYQAIRTHEW